MGSRLERDRPHPMTTNSWSIAIHTGLPVKSVWLNSTLAMEFASICGSTISKTSKTMKYGLVALR